MFIQQAIRIKKKLKKNASLDPTSKIWFKLSPINGAIQQTMKIKKIL